MIKGLHLPLSVVANLNRKPRSVLHQTLPYSVHSDHEEASAEECDDCEDDL